MRSHISETNESQSLVNGMANHYTSMNGVAKDEQNSHCLHLQGTQHTFRVPAVGSNAFRLLKTPGICATYSWLSLMLCISARKDTTAWWRHETWAEDSGTTTNHRHDQNTPRNNTSIRNTHNSPDIASSCHNSDVAAALKPQTSPWCLECACVPGSRWLDSLSDSHT